MPSSFPKDDGSPISYQEWEAALHLLVSELGRNVLLAIKESHLVRPDGWLKSLYNDMILLLGEFLDNKGFKWGKGSFEANIPLILEEATSRVEEDVAYFQAKIVFSD